MYCNQCGSQIAENAKFCFVCGNPVVFDSNFSGSILMKNKRSASRNKWIIIFVILILLLTVILLVVVFVPRSNESANSNHRTHE